MTNFISSFHVSTSSLFLTIKESDWEKTQNMHIELYPLSFPTSFESPILDENWASCASFPSAAQNGCQNKKIWLYEPRWLSIVVQALILKYRGGSDKNHVTNIDWIHRE